MRTATVTRNTSETQIEVRLGLDATADGDVPWLRVSDDGARAGVVEPGLPEARGQTYILPAGAFFDLKDGKISRVTTFYNLRDWIAQVSA